jgi:hypothetical protein
MGMKTAEGSSQDRLLVAVWPRLSSLRGLRRSPWRYAHGVDAQRYGGVEDDALRRPEERGAR